MTREQIEVPQWTPTGGGVMTSMSEMEKVVADFTGQVRLHRNRTMIEVSLRTGGGPMDVMTFRVPGRSLCAFISESEHGDTALVYAECQFAL